LYSSEVKTLEIKHLVEKISISIKSIEIGSIPLSTLLKEDIKSFPFPIAFGGTKRVPFILLVSSNANWCSVPDKTDVDEKTDSMNLPLGIDLESLYIAGLRKENKESQLHELNLEICVSEKGKAENKKCVSVVIPVNVKWIIDIPFIENFGRPDVDRTEITFNPLHLPNSSDKLQDEQIHVTNIGNTRITCDLLCPEWIRSDPACLVLEPDQTKESSIQIDSEYVKVGTNSGQIEITNSDIKINVSVDVTANGPVPQFENDILISIPQEKANADYIYTFEVVNVGNGELHVTLPTNMNDPKLKKTYNITDKLDILLTIPQSDLSSNQNDAFNFNIETNSVIERLKNILTRVQYTIEPVEEVKPLEKQEEQTEQKVDKKLVPSTINRKKDGTKNWKRIYVTISLAATLLVTIFLFVMFYSMRNSKPIPIPIPPKPPVTEIPTKKPQKSSVTSSKPRPLVPEASQEPSTPDVKKDEIQDITQEPKEKRIEPDPVRTTTSTSTSTPEPERIVSYITISIYTIPRAYVYVDEKQLLESDGSPSLTPLKKIIIESGKKHTIYIEAYNNPLKNKKYDQEFNGGDKIELYVGKGGW